MLMEHVRRSNSFDYAKKRSVDDDISKLVPIKQRYKTSNLIMESEASMLPSVYQMSFSQFNNGNLDKKVEDDNKSQYIPKTKKLINNNQVSDTLSALIKDDPPQKSPAISSHTMLDT